MELADKSLVLEVLRMPRLGLSPDQVRKIECIIDGGSPAMDPPLRPWVTYGEAAALLGLKTKRGVAYRIEAGVLDAYVPEGMERAVGVTRSSLERALARDKAS